MRVLRWSESKGRDEERDAVVLSAGEPPILRVGDEITWAFPGRISFPEMPEDPDREADAGLAGRQPAPRSQKVEVSYLANELSLEGRLRAGR